MKKILITISVIIIATIGFFVARPEPPFGAVQKYTADGKSFKLDIKSDPRDKISVVVGDKTKDSPEMTLSRWDEVS